MIMFEDIIPPNEITEINIEYRYFDLNNNEIYQNK